MKSTIILRKLSKYNIYNLLFLSSGSIIWRRLLFTEIDFLISNPFSLY